RVARGGRPGRAAVRGARPAAVGRRPAPPRSVLRRSGVAPGAVGSGAGRPVARPAGGADEPLVPAVAVVARTGGPAVGTGGPGRFRPVPLRPAGPCLPGRRDRPRPPGILGRVRRIPAGWNVVAGAAGPRGPLRRGGHSRGVRRPAHLADVPRMVPTG